MGAPHCQAGSTQGCRVLAKTWEAPSGRAAHGGTMGGHGGWAAGGGGGFGTQSGTQSSVEAGKERLGSA